MSTHGTRHGLRRGGCAPAATRRRILYKRYRCYACILDVWLLDGSWFRCVELLTRLSPTPANRKRATVRTCPPTC